MSDSDRLTTMQENPFWDPRFMISILIIGGFAVAYLHHPDATKDGALIGAFAGAWGYWLGSSSGAREGGKIIQTAQAQQARAMDIVEKQLPPPAQPDVTLQPGDKVTVAGADTKTDLVVPPLDPPSDPPEKPPWMS